jgi:predicted CoA-substrate-specific enzyme activase
MFRIGIDVGSTYTKYCVTRDGEIISLQAEKTQLRQLDYFEVKLAEFCSLYQDAETVACGYGKNNVPGVKNVNELIALAKGGWHVTKESGAILDIGGQDTKVIIHEGGKLKDFFVNEKCAAGSGMFLSNVLAQISLPFGEIDLTGNTYPDVKLSSTCAVFAQSEIVEMIADNRTEKEIAVAVIRQILTNAKALLSKISADRILISGGMSRIRGIADFAAEIFQKDCFTTDFGQYLSAIGCAVLSV